VGAEVVEVEEGVLEGDVAGDVVADGSHEAGALEGELGGGVDFGLDLLLGAEGEGAAVDFAAGDDVGLAVFGEVGGEHAGFAGPLALDDGDVFLLGFVPVFLQVFFDGAGLCEDEYAGSR
jgi:hypothetical protein